MNRIPLMPFPCGESLLLAKLIVLAFWSLISRVVFERRALVIVFTSLSKLVLMIWSRYFLLMVSNADNISIPVWCNLLSTFWTFAVIHLWTHTMFAILRPKRYTFWDDETKLMNFSFIRWIIKFDKVLRMIKSRMMGLRWFKGTSTSQFYNGTSVPHPTSSNSCC